MRYIFIIITILLIGNSYAEDTTKKEEYTRVHWNCDGRLWTKLGPEPETERVFLENNVVVRGKTRVIADSMEIIRVEEVVTKIIARGNVRIQHEETRAKGEMAVFDVISGQLVLGGVPEPVITNQGFVMTAPALQLDTTQSPPQMNANGPVLIVIEDVKQGED